jgi:hypothetical protein
VRQFSGSPSNESNPYTPPLSRDAAMIFSVVPL